MIRLPLLVLLGVATADSQLLSYFLSGVPHIFKQLTDPLVGRVPPASPSTGQGQVSVDQWLQENQAVARQFPWAPEVTQTAAPSTFLRTTTTTRPPPQPQSPIGPPPENLKNSAVLFPDYTDPSGFPPGFFDIDVPPSIGLPEGAPQPRYDSRIELVNDDRVAEDELSPFARAIRDSLAEEQGFGEQVVDNLDFESGLNPGQGYNPEITAPGLDQNPNSENLTPEAHLILEELDRIYANQGQTNNTLLSSSGLKISHQGVIGSGSSPSSTPDFTRFESSQQKPFLEKILQGLTTGLQALKPSQGLKRALQESVANRQQLLARLARTRAERLGRNKLPKADNLRAYPRRWQRRLLRAQTRKTKAQTRVQLPLLHELTEIEPLVDSQPIQNIPSTNPFAGQLIKNPSQIALDKNTQGNDEIPARTAFDQVFHNVLPPPGGEFDPRTHRVVEEVHPNQRQQILPDPSLYSDLADQRVVVEEIESPEFDTFELLEAAAGKDPVLNHIYRKNEELFKSNPNLPDKSTTEFLYRQLAGIEDRQSVESGRIKLIQPPREGPFLEESDLDDSTSVVAESAEQPPEQITSAMASKILSLALAHYDQDAKDPARISSNPNVFSNERSEQRRLSSPPGEIEDAPDYPSFDALSLLLQNNPELASPEGLRATSPRRNPPSPSRENPRSPARGNFPSPARENPPSPARRSLIDRLLAEENKFVREEEYEVPVLQLEEVQTTTTETPAVNRRHSSVSTGKLPKFRNRAGSSRLNWLNNLAGIVSPHHHPDVSRRLTRNV